MKELLSQIKQFNCKIDSVSKNRTIEQILELQKEWLDIVLQLIVFNQYELAYNLFYKVLINDNGGINEDWLSSDAAILDVMFDAYIFEKEEKVRCTFDNIKDLKTMKSYYDRTKMMLRRIEFDMPQESQRNLAKYVKDNAISAYFIIAVVQKSIINKVKVLNKSAFVLSCNNVMEPVLTLLLHSYNLDKDNQETICYLVYNLYKIGEVELADKLSKQIEDVNEYRVLIDNKVQSDDVFCDFPIPNEDVGDVSLFTEDFLETNNFEVEKKKKIAFICLVNNDELFSECKLYIDNLAIPSGYEIVVIPIYGAKSMTEGYEKGMKQVDAEYKIYLHQDVLCIYKDMLFEILKIFEKDNDIGLLGVAGTPEIPLTGIWWEAKTQYRNLYQDNIVSFGCEGFVDDKKLYNHYDYQDAVMLDGAFLATHGDVDWRSDVFDGWHFYDISQCMEYIRSSKRVVIARCDAPWVMHYGDYVNILDSTYEKYRMMFLKEYNVEIQKLHI